MYSAVVIGNYDWLQVNKGFSTSEDAQAWVDATVKENNSRFPGRRDWGYVIADAAPKEKE